jgi:Uma2 family endonuclease
MAEAGVFGPEEKVQLIDGQIVRMSPAGSPHASTVRRITAAFYAHITREVTVLVQDPLEASARDMPEPDVALLQAGDYDERHPTAAETLLAVEVSDSTLRFDRQHKVPMYARTGVPELWIVALPERVVYLYRTPTPDGYASVVKLGDGDALEPACCPGAQIAVTDVLPRRRA